MLEKDIENLIAAYPEEFFPGEGFKLISQQYFIEGRRIDILFEDKLGRKIIVEVKRGILTREAAGQIAEYYGLLKEKERNNFFELILCANVIPKERRLFLENIGISCKEVSIAFLSEIAKKYDYTFIDDRPSFENHFTTIQDSLRSETELDDSDISIWIFQANPQKYDILNALSDKNLGNRIHWTVNQYRGKIKKGHLGFIWMSGAEAGIYALTRIETNPSLMKEFPAERKYWLDPIDKEEKIRVEMTILRKFVNRPILKKKLLSIPGLESLSIIKCPQGTNFPVTNREWKIISQLF